MAAGNDPFDEEFEDGGVARAAADEDFGQPHTPAWESGTAESRRLLAAFDRTANWQRWGPYLSERQWGTVREDYSSGGDAWEFFPFEHAQSRAYRWGEDGLLGFTDRQCRLCLAVALWNGKDPILKERLFGLTNAQGNHGEDVKEEYFYLDSTPTHTYSKALYKYPQAEFPYDALRRENGRRGRNETEYELRDTGIFDDGRYWDVEAEYAKAGPNDILLRLTIRNRGDKSAEIHTLPTLWFRNSWSWGCAHEGCSLKPRLERKGDPDSEAQPWEVVTSHDLLEPFDFAADPACLTEQAEMLFCDNQTNRERLFGDENLTKAPKDAIERYVVGGEKTAVMAKPYGTKVSVADRHVVPAGGSVELRYRLVMREERPDGDLFGAPFDRVFEERIAEADAFYGELIPDKLDQEQTRVARQAYAGLMWTKQFYHYIVEDWLQGDPHQPKPPGGRGEIRNGDWPHLFNRDVISVCDAWEYPWYAAWDLAFHMIPFSRVDPHFAKQQLVLFTREWYMHPNGAIPAYEWNFSDVNPPVHAWAAWRVYKLTGPRGGRDRTFLARMFLKLLLNFTWWTNRKDANGDNLFSGGFLGMDNIGVFDRSAFEEGKAGLEGVDLEQADATAWMAFYCVVMLSMAIELAKEAPEYESIASKFFEHFVQIADAMNRLGEGGMWDDGDGFYYDVLKSRHGGGAQKLRTRSMVGLVPLFAVLVIEQDDLDALPHFKKRLKWFVKNRPELVEQVAFAEEGGKSRRLLAIPSKERLKRVLKYVSDEEEFLSPYGVRSLSKHHEKHPFRTSLNGQPHEVKYVPGDSDSWMFGGNSNWRGPVWFPMNFLLIEALERYQYFYGDEFKVEWPARSGNLLTLKQIAADLSARLVSLFLPDGEGRRPCHGEDPRYAEDPNYRDLVLFYEYFHGDDGRGLGASHQTGWTALAASLLETCAKET